MSLLSLLSITATSSTIGLFLCGIPICLRIRRDKSTKGTSPAPFLVASLSCALWLHYGVLRQDQVVILVNAVGLFLQLSYLIFFVLHITVRAEKTRIRRVIAAEVLFFSVIEYLIKYNAASDGLSLLGVVCVLLNITNIAAPLFAVGEVIRNKSSESLPFPLCTANLLVSLQWFAYGYLVNDYVIKTPNSIAICLSIIQLSLFIIYPSVSKGLRFLDFFSRFIEANLNQESFARR